MPNDIQPVSPVRRVPQDVRYAVRSLAHSLGFTLAAIGTFALGIGANVAIFSVVNAVLLRPLPFPDPQRIVSVWSGGGPSRGIFATIRDRSKSYEQIAAYRSRVGMTLSGRGEPERIKGALATPSLLPTLRVAPMLGRNFRAGEDQPGTDHVVILGYDLWQQHFGSDRGVIGSTITLDGVSRVVVGVMPAGFHFPTRDTQVWTPVVMDLRNLGDFWGSGNYQILGRLRPGVTVDQAQREARALGPQIRRANPVWDAGPTTGQDAMVIPLQTETSGNVRPTLLILLAAVAVVLLIACANVANLLLVRASAQSKAFAIRSALGARRRRLIAQLLTESLLLSASGAVVGVAIAWLAVAPLSRALLAESPQLATIAVDVRVMTFALVLALLVGVLTGVAPALRSSDPRLQSLLNDASRGSSVSRGQRRLSDILVMTEVTLAVMLVVGAGLLVRSFWELRKVDLGFRPAAVTSARIDLAPQTYADDDRVRGFYTALLQRMRSVPGVRSAAATTEVPLGGRSGMAFRVQGQIEDLHHVLPSAGGYHVITPGYLQTLGIPLLKGRAFTDADRKGAPDVVLVNAALARRFWPNGNAVGQRIGYPWPSEWLTVVGVVGDVRETDVGGPDTTMTIYRPFLQAPTTTMIVVVKSASSPASIAANLRRAVGQVDPSVPVSQVQTMEDVMASSVAKPRATMLLLTAFAGVALLLGAIGIYGVIAYAVAQRKREIGIRMALGAQPTDVLRLVIRHGAALAAVGTVVGLLLSLASTRTLASFLYGVNTTDPVTYAAAPLLLIGVALLASYIPARRAASLDPVTVLNAE